MTFPTTPHRGNAARAWNDHQRQTMPADMVAEAASLEDALRHPEHYSPAGVVVMRERAALLRQWSGAAP